MIKNAVVPLAGLLLASLAMPALSQSKGIYSCVDGKGRKLTADRPIAECADRVQNILNPSGTVKSTLGPTLTGKERAEQETRQKREAEELARQAEEKRRERALLVRYPNQDAHDKERAEAIAQIGVVRRAAVNRVTELLRQKDELGTEMEFYKKDPSKAPASLRRQLDDVDRSLAVQGRFISEQDAEIARVNARFDDERLQLRQLWARRTTGTAAGAGK